MEPVLPIKAHIAQLCMGRQAGVIALSKSNESMLFQEGALSKESGAIPAVIRDAIELVRDLNGLDKG